MSDSPARITYDSPFEPNDEDRQILTELSGFNTNSPATVQVDRTLPSIYILSSCLHVSHSLSFNAILSSENCCVCGLTMTTKHGQMQHMKVIITTKLTTCSII